MVKIIERINLFIGKLLGRTPLTDEQLVYEGVWRYNSIEWIEINKNGSASTRTKGKHLLNVKLIFENNIIQIGTSFLKERYEITKPPYQANGEWLLELNGRLYRKTTKDFINIDEYYDNDFLDD